MKMDYLQSLLQPKMLECLEFRFGEVIFPDMLEHQGIGPRLFYRQLYRCHVEYLRCNVSGTGGRRCRLL